MKEEFPDLFKASCLKKVSVAAIGDWFEGVWQWGDFILIEANLVDPVFLEDVVSLMGGWRIFADGRKIKISCFGPKIRFWSFRLLHVMLFMRDYVFRMVLLISMTKILG